MSIFSSITMAGIDYLSTLFVFLVGLFVAVLVVLFVVDISQTRDAVRRNYPPQEPYRDRRDAA